MSAMVSRNSTSQRVRSRTRLTKRRQQLDLLLSDVARQIGRPVKWVNRFERGESVQLDDGLSGQLAAIYRLTNDELAHYRAEAEAWAGSIALAGAA